MGDKTIILKLNSPRTLKACNIKGIEPSYFEEKLSFKKK